ncbi:hypothetical protein [uncultured Devosia sp.]|uniref:hypothetical protein n=1 Tax=uncultured Devosia sp. TaxID=211434 RepID=UPI0026319C15|nr:hypothetical protein [uncultured Devosia sp.]
MSAIPIDAAGRFAGYASVFNKLDSGGDIVLPGLLPKASKSGAGGSGCCSSMTRRSP